MEGKPIARVPIKSRYSEDGIYVTDKTMTVRRKDKNYIYLLENIYSLTWQQKMLLLPIMAGGLLSSLSVIAYMNEFLHPLLLIIFFIGGIFLMYYGFDGANALIINMSKNQDHYIMNSNDDLVAFTNFVNTYLLGSGNLTFYLSLTPEEWAQAQMDKLILVEDKKELFMNKSSKSNKIDVTIKYEELPGAISFIKTANNEIRPYVTRNVPLEAVLLAG